MAAELERLWWYGDPESLDLRDALAANMAAVRQQIVVGAGIDDLMGLVVRAFCRPEAGGDDARNVSHVQLSRDRVRRRAGICRLSAGRKTRSRRAAAWRATEAPRIVYLANPDNPSGRFIGRGDDASFCRALPRRRAVAARRSVRRLRLTGRSAADLISTTRSSACGRSRKPTAWPGRGSATRSATASATRHVPEDSAPLQYQSQRADRRAGIARPTTLSRDRVVAKPRGPRRLLGARARTRVGGFIESLRTSCASTWERAASRALVASCSSAACGSASRARRRSIARSRQRGNHEPMRSALPRRCAQS